MDSEFEIICRKELSPRASGVPLLCRGGSLRITKMDGRAEVEGHLEEVEAPDGPGHRQDQGEV